jgi:hypothetical protein
MTIITSLCTSFKQDLFQGLQDLSSDTVKMAWYESSAVLSSATTAYTATGEVTGTGYSAGGFTLTGNTVWTDGTAVGVGFDSFTVLNASISNIQGALLYNSSVSNKAIAVINFGNSYTFTTQNIAFTFPPNNGLQGIIKITGN